MKIQREYLCQVIDEVGPLLLAHHVEVNSAQADVDPDWDLYASMERAGNYVLFTARKDDKLVGYSGFFLAPNIHARTERLIINDVLYLSPKHRGVGGIRLLKYGEQQLGKPGARIVYTGPPESALMKLLPRLGYTLQETKFGKTF